MPEPMEIKFPLINPNEPDSYLVAVYVKDGQHVMASDPLFILETTKATQEVVSPSAGFILGIKQLSGATVHAGDLFCYLSEDPSWQPPVTRQETPESSVSPSQSDPILDELRITRPARLLVESLGLPLELLPRRTLITEQLVRSIAVSTSLSGVEKSPPPTFDPTAIIVYGGGGHGKSLIDLILATGGYHIVGIIDDNLPTGARLLGFPVLGGKDILPGLYQDGVRLAVNAVGGIGNVRTRINVFNQLYSSGFGCPALIHPTAWVEPSAVISPGVQVFPHAYVGSSASLGFGVIINTGAIVSHDCTVGDYANLSPGATLAGGVEIDMGTLVGMRATINLQVKIGAYARIGNGATVKTDVPPEGIVSAGSTWPRN